MKLCPLCKSEINFDLSEVHLIPSTDPMEAGYEGICENCCSHVYLRFKLHKIEVIEFDDLMEEKSSKVFNV